MMLCSVVALVILEPTLNVIAFELEEKLTAIFSDVEGLLADSKLTLPPVIELTRLTVLLPPIRKRAEALFPESLTAIRNVPLEPENVTVLVLPVVVLLVPSP